MILELGPRNTDSDHQRDRRQRHTDGAGSTVQLPIRNHPGSPKARQGCGVAGLRHRLHSGYGTVTGQENHFLRPSPARHQCRYLQAAYAGTDLRSPTAPQGFPRLVGASNAIEING